MLDKWLYSKSCEQARDMTMKVFTYGFSHHLSAIILKQEGIIVAPIIDVVVNMFNKCIMLTATY